MSTTRPAARGGSLRDLVLPAAVALAATATVAVVAGQGAFSLPGLAVLVLLGAGLVVLVLHRAPYAFLAITPVVLPLPPIGPIFPLEIAFAFSAALVLVRAIRDRAPWALRLQPLEIANLALVAWAAFSGLWCTNSEWYSRGMRRIALGAASLWLALRLPRLLPRPAYDWSLLLCAGAITTATLVHRVSVGLTPEQALADRGEATDLGWGTANYIASLLLLLSPLVLEMALRPRARGQRPVAWVTLAGIAIVQGVVASRAAAMLFALGLVIQVWRMRNRRDLVTLGSVLAGMFALFASPLGQGILFRFTSLRELGSMTVRLWYWRVAWRRIVDHFPWGMGWFQGWVYPDRLYMTDTHNYWLTLASELGVPGLVAWVAVLTLIVRGVIRVHRDPGEQTHARALMVAFVLSQLHTLVEPTFEGLQYQFLYFWVIGGSLAYGLAGARPEAASSRR